MEMKDLLEELRRTIEGARSMPMSSSAVINRGEVMSQIERLEQAISRSVRAVRAGLRPIATQMMTEAQERAARIVEEAGFEHDRLVSDTEVYRIAVRQADELRETTKRECEALRHETDEYVDTRLANFEITLNKTLEAVTRGRDRLQGRHQLDQASLDSLASLEDTGTIPPLPRH